MTRYIIAAKTAEKKRGSFKEAHQTNTEAIEQPSY
jgi:hypothetical protein